MFDKLFSSEVLAEALDIIMTEFPLAVWETLYVDRQHLQYSLPCAGGKRFDGVGFDEQDLFLHKVLPFLYSIVSVY